ncbi:MAG: hypothetical protein HY700_05345 [Gemmatimonadetes bacterium]|nr:hypothetical protein [Gemmatimonadota bacterium]
MRTLLLHIVIVLNLGSIPSLVAQDREAADPTRAWASVGVGAGTEGFAGAAGFDVLARKHLFSVRAAGVANVLDDEFWDLAVLYGRAGRWSRGLVAASTGVAVMGGERCSGLGGCTPVSARIGLPVAAHLAWQALPFLGLAVYGFANINSAQSFAGTVAAIQLGRVR